jgi:hypothetical protein
VDVSAQVSAKQRVVDELLARPGVNAVDVGFKYVKGKQTDQVAIRVHVASKKPMSRVAKGEQIPDEIDGFPTDVIERTYVPQQLSNRMAVEDITLQADTTTYRPVKGGISIGPCRAVGGFVFAGTLGAIVKDNASGDPMMLSNFHVMCVDDGWNVGDDMTQPSRVDTGSCPADTVGQLNRATLSAAVDGAVASFASGIGHTCEIEEVGAVAGTNTATLSMPVRKRGRTTGLTHGTVESISLSVNIDYGDGIGVRTLTNQVGVAPDTAQNAKFSDHGDSGSVIVDNDRKVVALLFAGSDDGHTIGNPIAAVLSELNISLCVPIVKSFLKDKIEHKEKLEIKEKLEHKEKLEIKEKVETKDLKDRIKEWKEKDFKEHKPEKFEFERKDLVADFRWPRDPGDPLQPGPLPPDLPGPSGLGVSGLGERIAALEATVGQLAAFITAAERPDLTAGALTNEADTGDSTANPAKLQKEAAEAAAYKSAQDTGAY